MENSFPLIPGNLENFADRLHTSDDLNTSAEEPVRIMLVEDEPSILCLFEKILALRGWHVLPVDNAGEAIKYWEKENLDLIFMDLQLPNMNGLEATRIIRRLEMERGRKHIPIIALTAWCRPEDREFCMEAGMDDYLPKPIHKKELYEMVDKYLTRISG